MNQLGNTIINPLHGSCKIQKPCFNLPGSGFSSMIIFLNSIFASNSEVKFIIINSSCFPIKSCQWTISKTFRSLSKYEFTRGTQRQFLCRNFAPLWLTVEKELNIKDYPLNDPPPFLCGFSLALGSSQRSSLHGGYYDLPTSQLGRSWR